MNTGFWANAAMEPKRQFRFLLEVSPLESYTITKVNRPSFDIGESEHKFINHTFYYPGRVTWNEVSFSMIDPVLPDNTGILMKMLMASGYRFPSDVNRAQKTISKAEATMAVGSCQIKVIGSGEQANPDGGVSGATPLEVWTLKNPWIKSVSMGDLDYGSDDLLGMDVTLRYDWAELSFQNVDGIFIPNGPVPDAAAPVTAGLSEGDRVTTPLASKNPYVASAELK